MTAADLLQAIEARYPADRGWLHVEEAGGAFGRRVDRLAINLWASRGYQIIGFEVKVSRPDWIRELKKPEKADQSLFQFCDEWWVVCAPDVVREDEEVPATWGWAEARSDGKLRTRRKAPALSPRPISRAFLAAVVKRFEAKDGSALAEMRDQARREAHEHHEAMSRLEREQYREEVAKLKAEVSRLRPMRGWSTPENEERLIKLAQLLMGRGYGSIDGLLSGAREKAKTALGELERATALLDELERTPAG